MNHDPRIMFGLKTLKWGGFVQFEHCCGSEMKAPVDCSRDLIGWKTSSLL